MPLSRHHTWKRFLQSWIGISALLFLISTSVYGQKSSYLQLAQNTQSRGFDMDFEWFHVKEDSTLLNVLIQIPHQQLSFERTNHEQEPYEVNATNADGHPDYYIADYEINLEVYRGDYEDQNTRELVQRIFISDTIQVDTYEQTLDQHVISTYLSSTPLEVGSYTIHVTYQSIKGLVSMTGVTSKQDPESSFEFRSSNRRKKVDHHPNKRYISPTLLQEKGVLLAPPNNVTDGQVYFLEQATAQNFEYIATNDDQRYFYSWIGSANKITFGRKASIAIPNYSIADYQNLYIDIYDAKLDSVLWNKAVEVSTDKTFALSRVSDALLPLSNSTDSLGGYFTIIDLPTERLQNAPYQLRIHTEAKSDPFKVIDFQTYWKTMPISLYQIDVAIDMLRYIVGDETIDPILKKSNSEKLAFFTSFWDPKDPIVSTPENELMTEYYRRIDYAFKTFGTTSEPLGYQSDQGQLYIKLGPPIDIKRSFPANGKVLEEWTYPNGTYLFTASTGFGDFKLISTPQKPTN